MTLDEIQAALTWTEATRRRDENEWDDEALALYYLRHIALLTGHDLRRICEATDGYRATKSHSLMNRVHVSVSFEVLEREAARLRERRALVDAPRSGVSTAFETGSQRSIQHAANHVIAELRETTELLPRWLEGDQMRLFDL